MGISHLMFEEFEDDLPQVCYIALWQNWAAVWRCVWLTSCVSEEAGDSLLPLLLGVVIWSQKAGLWLGFGNWLNCEENGKKKKKQKIIARIVLHGVWHKMYENPSLLKLKKYSHICFYMFLSKHCVILQKTQIFELNKILKKVAHDFLWL